MQTNDIIRAVLDMLDKLEDAQHCEPSAEIEVSIPNEPGEQTSRFKQIFAMLNDTPTGEYSNSPNEIVAPMSSVTTDAGGGVNGSKHPADIRVKDQGYGHGGQ